MCFELYIQFPLVLLVGSAILWLLATSCHFLIQCVGALFPWILYIFPLLAIMPHHLVSRWMTPRAHSWVRTTVVLVLFSWGCLEAIRKVVARHNREGCLRFANDSSNFVSLPWREHDDPRFSFVHCIDCRQARALGMPLVFGARPGASCCVSPILPVQIPCEDLLQKIEWSAEIHTRWRMGDGTRVSHLIIVRCKDLEQLTLESLAEASSAEHLGFCLAARADTCPSEDFAVSQAHSEADSGPRLQCLTRSIVDMDRDYRYLLTDCANEESRLESWP